jgi:mono/diheme cytochrome c family protein
LNAAKSRSSNAGELLGFPFKMKLRPICVAAAGLIFAAGVSAAIAAQPSNAVTTTPVYVPDYSHAGQPLPDGLIAWDAVMKTTNVVEGQEFARFTFSFTNTAAVVDRTWTTNVVKMPARISTVTNSWLWHRKVSTVTNFVAETNLCWVTNHVTPLAITILNVHPSCGCTTAELPPVPWRIAPGTNGQINIKVNLEGKIGTLFKFITITTDRGQKQLDLRINIIPTPPIKLTDAQRAAGVAAAKVDRQAVFKGDCASCHAKNLQGKYGQALFNAVCAVCHEASPRATMVPDLHNLKVPTNEEFWRTWITAGKAGTLMPAFATSQGGPLNDLQIASLAAYLNAVNPSRVTAPR